MLTRFLTLLERRRGQLLERAAGVEQMRSAIAPLLEKNQTVAEALALAQARIPAQNPSVYPGVFAWKRQRATDLETGLDRLAVMYQTLPEEVARRDFLVGMRVRSECVYRGMAAMIEAISALLQDAGEQLEERRRD